MISRARIVGGSLCSLLALSAPAPAAWLTWAELEPHCNDHALDASSHGGAICAAFVQGVVAGAQNGSVGDAARLWPSDSFTERAVRTRLSSRIPQPAFCIDPEEPAASVVAAVVARLQARDGEPPRPGASAARLVYDALVASFPCGSR